MNYGLFEGSVAHYFKLLGSPGSDLLRTPSNDPGHNNLLITEKECLGLIIGLAPVAFWSCSLRILPRWVIRRLFLHTFS